MEELPTGWEKVYDASSGRFYYIDHINQKTQWDNPSSGYAPPAAAGRMKILVFGQEFNLVLQ